MAKTKNPLLSLDAHGSLADILTYSHRKSGKQVRLYNKPLKPASAKQRGQRRLTEFLIAQWQNMSAGDKATWETNAVKSGLKLPGYHYFLRETQRNLYLHHGLAGYWHCNEIVGGKVLDLSGNANHGTLKPDYPVNAPVLVDSYKTKFSKALLYDGVDEYIDCGHGASLHTPTTSSIDIWLNPSRLDADEVFFGKGVYETDGWYIRNYLGRVVFNPNRAAETAWRNTSIYLTKDKWINIVVTLNNTTLDTMWYVNGSYIETIVLAWAILFNSDRNLHIGEYSTGGFNFMGRIDEVTLYNRILSASEISARYKFATREID